MASPKSPHLAVLTGASAGATYIFDPVDNVLIGSDPSCQLCIESEDVSPIHARIWVDAEGVTVFDTHSPTGIYVNDDRVVEKAPLRNGDILWLGSPGVEGSVMVQVVLPPAGEAGLAVPPLMMPAEEETAAEPEMELAVPEAEYTAWRRRVTTRQDIEARVAAVRFEGLDRVNPDYLRTLSRIEPGDLPGTEHTVLPFGNNNEDIPRLLYCLAGTVDYFRVTCPDFPVMVYACKTEIE